MLFSLGTSLIPMTASLDCCPIACTRKTVLTGTETTWRTASRTTISCRSSNRLVQITPCHPFSNQCLQVESGAIPKSTTIISLAIWAVIRGCSWTVEEFRESFRVTTSLPSRPASCPLGILLNRYYTWIETLHTFYSSLHRRKVHLYSLESKLYFRWKHQTF